MRGALLGLGFALSAALLPGCGTLAYYAQAVGGQMEISGRARPIEAVLADPMTGERLKARLALVREARVFASRELALPDNGSFTRYADLARPFAVWNVFAAPELSVEPLTWCFPVAGCVAYRGYFSEAAARQAADELARKGYDVFVAGIPVYSTLGWFDDPVLDTFVHYPEAELVGLIFHELAHQRVYVPGDTAFNESFATTVEEEGVRRWFAQRNEPAAMATWHQRQTRRREFAEFLTHIRDRLARAYAEAPSVAAAREAKAGILAQARAEYDALRRQWGGYPGYDRWFNDTPLNNAKLASATLYTDLVPAFRELLVRAGHDLPAFYAQVDRLAALPREARARRLAALTEGSGLGFDRLAGGD